MQIEKFLQELIQDKSDYMLTEEDKKTIQFEGVGTFIYKKLNSSKYRVKKNEENFDNSIKEVISYCVENELPLHVNLGTGATKSPNAPKAPGIDWAEVFSIALLREYLKPIAAAYKPGLVLDYYSVALFEDKVNHIPQEDVDLYDKQFSELIKYSQDYLPKNFTLNYKRLSDETTKDKIYPIIDAEVEKLKKAWDKVPEDEKKEKLMRAERNMVFPKSSDSRDELILTSALAHDAFANECWAKEASPLWNDKDQVSLGHRYTSGWGINVRSAQASTVNYWSGTGVLIEKENKYITTVLSPKQYKDTESKIDIADVSFFKDNLILKQKLSEIGTYKG